MLPHELLQTITDAGDPMQHRIHLDKMMICWMKHNEADRDAEGMHLTYAVLDNMLRGIQGTQVEQD